MRSSRDVLNRLLHDESLNLAHDACVGYLDRFKGAMELSLPKFATGDIPLHRVLYFRNGSEVLWHKETRFDIVYSSSDASLAYTADSIRKRRSDVEQAEKNRQEMEEVARVKRYTSKRKFSSIAAAFSELHSIPIHQCSVLSGHWISCRSCSAKPTTRAPFEDEQYRTTLQIATFNVLQHTFLPEVLKQVNDVRWRAILKHVKECNVHIWVFTEATPPFAHHLLSDQFVRNNYFASDSSASSFRTLSGDHGATGQLVLIRRDLSVEDAFYATTPLANGKRLVFVTATLPSGARAVLCALHLTSGQVGRSDSTSAIEKRHKQLGHIVSKMKQFIKGFDVHILVGDFNFKSERDEVANERLLEGYKEADNTLHAPTYDTARNGLAFLNAKESKSMRLDRIYIRDVSKRHTVTAQSHCLLGEGPIEEMELKDELTQLLPFGLHASDHFGVSTTFRFGGSANMQHANRRRWTTSTALAVLLEPDTEKRINSIWRNKYDPAVEKWPAHINILYPFVNEDCLEEVCSSIRDTMIIHRKNVPERLSMEMDTVGTFKHKSSSTVYLEPADNSLRILRQLLLKTCMTTVGDADEPSVEKRNTYIPHMTIAKLKGLGDQEISQFVEKAKTDLLNRVSSLRTCTVQQLSVLRRINGRMVTTDVISIPKYKEISPMRRSLDLVRSLARRILGSEAQYQVQPVGSSTLLQNEACNDLDIVLLPGTGQRICSALDFSWHMESLLPDGVTIRCVSDASCPIIAMDLGDSDYLPVDIMYGESDFAHQAVLDSKVLFNNLKEKSVQSRSIFRKALAQLKRWAKSKQLTGKAFTLFPGVSWSILLFSICAEEPRTIWKDWRLLLIAFFEEYRDFEWKANSLSLNGPEKRESQQVLSGRNCSDDACVIISPGSRQNVACLVSKAVLKAFSREAGRALLALRSKVNQLSWPAYVEECTEIDKEYDNFIEITVYSCEVSNCKLLSGWLKGKFASFAVQELQTKGISIRPTDDLVWSRTKEKEAISFRGEVSCGIDEELTSAEKSKWKSFVKDAETHLLDKFLRWSDRPSKSMLNVTLNLSNASREEASSYKSVLYARTIM